LINSGRIAPSESLADTLLIVVNGDVNNRGQMGCFAIECSGSINNTGVWTADTRLSSEVPRNISGVPLGGDIDLLDDTYIESGLEVPFDMMPLAKCQMPLVS
jgi:hypothetical protein